MDRGMAGGAGGWGHVAGPGDMWQGVWWHGVVACGRVWGHVVGGRGM